MKGPTKIDSNPLSMATTSLINSTIKKFIRNILSECVEDITNDYLNHTKSLFIYNNILMPRVIVSLIKDTVMGSIASDRKSVV